MFPHLKKQQKSKGKYFYRQELAVDAFRKDYSTFIEKKVNI